MSDRCAPCPANQAEAKDSKARPHERRICLIEPPSADTDFWFAIRIDLIDTVRQARRVESHHYLAREVPAEGMGHGCRGFEVEKLGPDLFPIGVVYHVLMDPRVGYSSCDCRGHDAHKHCKHASGIEALVRGGHLPANYRSGGDMKRNAPEELEEHLTSIAEPEGPDQCPPYPEIPEAWPGERSEPPEPADDRPDVPVIDVPPAAQQPREPWDYPDEVPELPPWSDYQPDEEGPDPRPAA